jgi:hypothetical protein
MEIRSLPFYQEDGEKGEVVGAFRPEYFDRERFQTVTRIFFAGVAEKYIIDTAVGIGGMKRKTVAFTLQFPDIGEL